MIDEARELGLDVLRSLSRLIAGATPRKPPTTETVTLFRELYDRLAEPAVEDVRKEIQAIRRDLGVLTARYVLHE